MEGGILINGKQCLGIYVYVVISLTIKGEVVTCEEDPVLLLEVKKGAIKVVL